MYNSSACHVYSVRDIYWPTRKVFAAVIRKINFIPFYSEMHVLNDIAYIRWVSIILKILYFIEAMFSCSHAAIGESYLGHLNPGSWRYLIINLCTVSRSHIFHANQFQNVIKEWFLILFNCFNLCLIVF